MTAQTRPTIVRIRSIVKIGWASRSFDDFEDGFFVGVDVGPDVGEAVGVEVGPGVGVAVGVEVGPDVGVAVGVAVGEADGAADGAADGEADGEADGVADGEAHALKHAEEASVVSGPFTEHRVRSSATHAQFFVVSPKEAATLAETGVGLRGCACAGAAHVT
jgi:hypothetical protein